MRTAHCSSHLLGVDVCPGGGVCVCPGGHSRGQNDRCLWKHYLATTMVKIDGSHRQSHKCYVLSPYPVSRSATDNNWVLHCHEQFDFSKKKNLIFVIENLRFHCNSLVSIVQPSSFHCRDIRFDDFAVEICWHQYYWFYFSLLCITWQLCVMTSHPGHFLSHVFVHNEIEISQSQTNCCYEQRALTAFGNWNVSSM